MGTRGWTDGDSHGQLPGVSGLSPTQHIGWEALGCRSALRILICFILKLLCKEDTEEEFSLQRLTR